MYEVKSDYHAFRPVAQAILTEAGRPNLSNLLEQDRIKHLFLQPVDHALGYEDGGAMIPVKKMNRRCLKLTERDRRKLYEMGRILQSYIPKGSDEEKRIVAQGVNQLVQCASWRCNGPTDWDRSPRKHILEELARSYHEGTIPPITSWDAQDCENRSFYHIRKLNNAGYLGLFGLIVPILGTAGAYAAGFPEAGEAIMATGIFGLGIGLVNGIALTQLSLALQDITNSPNTTPKLITNRHYRFARHPLYSIRLVSHFGVGMAGLNPISWKSSISSIYHASKGMHLQDERMKRLHGEEAAEYQEKTPCLIPGSKRLMRGLRKVLPEKVSKLLETEVWELMERMGFKDENYYVDDKWDTSADHYKGIPNAHLYTPLEAKSEPKGLCILVNDYKIIGRDFCKAGRFIGRKVRKHYKAWQKRKKWKQHVRLEGRPLGLLAH